MSGGTNGAAPAAQLVQEVPLGEIIRSPFNRDVDTKAPEFAELVDSIRIHGVIQPGLARPLPSALDPARKAGAPRLELVIGEHRWLGSQAAKRATMPLIVRQLTDLEVVELQTIENDKRKDLSPIEEAEKYQQLLEQYEKAGANKEAAIAQLCQKLSKGKSTVYEALRLLKLPAPVKAAVTSGKLPASHAGLIAKLPEASQAEVAILIAPPKGTSVRDLGKMAAGLGLGYMNLEFDDEAGLISFRDSKEIVDRVARHLEQVAQYEVLASAYRKKGGIALNYADAREHIDKYLAGDTYLGEYRDYVRNVIKGVADLPGLVMRPQFRTPSKPEMVYDGKALMDALKKAGVKPPARQDGSMAAYRARERKRNATLAIKRKILKAVVEPIRTAASKRNAKIPWPLFLSTLQIGRAHV